MASGKVTGVSTLLMHAPALLQVLSAPPAAHAVFETPGTADARGVTGMANETGDIVPAGTRQVMSCRTTLQPAGSVPMLNEGGMLSVTTASAARVVLLLLSFSV